MNELAVPVVTSRGRRGRRRRRRASPPWRKGLIALGVLVLVLAGGMLAFSAWLHSYLQSEKFRVWISGELSRKLDAEVELTGIRWQDASAYAGKLTASGHASAPFALLEAQDVRTDINTGAIWERVWQIDAVKVARATLNLTGDAPRREPAVSGGSDSAGASGSGFLSGLLPNKTVVKGIRVDQFGFAWKDGGRSVTGRDIVMDIEPGEGHEALQFTGGGGEMALTALAGVPVTLENFHATWSEGELHVDDVRAAAAGARIMAEGVLRTGDAPSLTAHGTVDEMELAKCIPEDWLKRLTGKAGGEVRISGNPKEPARLLWRGHARLHNAVLQGLPVLEIIARKTRNESFTRLLLREARAEFTRTPEAAWMLEKIMVDAPGLLRLKGTAHAGADDSLRGELLLGIVPGTLRFIAGAEQHVFLPIERASLSAAERALLTPDDHGLLWTKLRLGGTLDHPTEDLADRLASAWFNATVDEVLNLSMEAAVKVAENATVAAESAAATVLDVAPKIIEQAPKVLEEGTGLIQEGFDLIDRVLPK